MPQSPEKPKIRFSDDLFLFDPDSKWTLYLATMPTSPLLPARLILPSKAMRSSVARSSEIRRTVSVLNRNDAYAGYLADS